MLALVRGRRPARGVYDSVCEASAGIVIRRYSSSFGAASRLLGAPLRGEIRNVYALVRVADEIVDHPDHSLGRPDRERMLAALHDDVRAALRTGHSANLVVHAFAGTARRTGIAGDLVDPFFASMGMDLTRVVHDEESFARYVHGSAEVVGLMCLRVFLAHDHGGAATYDDLSSGARSLGAAFQKINFLRDLAEDHDVLGRSYFPGLDVDTFDDADRDRILDDVDADLAVAASSIPRLPADARRGVRAAHATFAELSCRLRATPAAKIRTRRVSVPPAVKARLVAGAMLGERS